ncbi:MAG: ATP-binding protein, partial [Thermoproteota archaeon]|nr:ATP-binding protein [Thermoproteota archaeon]
ALIIDAIVSTVPDFIQDQITSLPGVTLFILIGCAFVLGQYFVLQFIKEKTKEVRSKSRYLNVVHKVVEAVQLTLAAIFAFVIFEMLFTGLYHLMNLLVVTALSYTLNIIIMILFAERLLRWYRSNRNTIVLLLFAITAIFIAFTTVMAIIADVRHLTTKDAVVTPTLPIVFPTSEPGTLARLLSDLYHNADIISTFLVWSTTILLLYHYFDKLNRVSRMKVWFFMTLPMIYYLSVFAGAFDLISPETESEWFWYYVYMSLNSTAAAILFGLAFRVVAKSIRRSSAVRNYIIISAYGFVLLFISNQSAVNAASYPPYGQAGVSVAGLSAYLIFVGIYSAGISISEDVNLRRSIKKTATEEAKLLVSIGSAQMQELLEKKVLHDARERANEMTDRTGVQLSLTDGDMRHYLNIVLREINVIQNFEEIVRKGKEILETSVDYSACLRDNGLRLVHSNYFDAYKRVLERHKAGEHDGVRLVTSIDKNSIELIRSFLRIGVQIRHVKNLPPIDFAVSDKEMMATILKWDYGERSQNLLISNEAAYLRHFDSIFEEIWKSGIDAENRIQAIEEGVDSEGIEILQNPNEILKLRQDLIRSAQEDILVVYPTLEYVHTLGAKAEPAGIKEILKDAVQRGIRVKIVTSRDEAVEETFRFLVSELSAQQKFRKLVEIRYMEPQLQTKVSVVIIDKTFSLAIELKDYTKHSHSLGIIGLATYSNSKATVLSYVSFFETLWKQTDMYEQLKVHDRMQREFINVAAHELRNPIQPLMLSSESLKDSMPDEERVSIVIRNAKKLQILANEILDITKIESNTLTLRRERVELNEIILYGMKDLLELQAISGGRVNVVYVPGNEDIFVEADRDRLGQVISNLLNNSMKFTEAGTISITAERSADENEATVSVKDTGSGIDPEIFPRLFSKFATKSDTGGTGLGLYICKNIIEAHGGKIWAENNPDGKGATFTFSLPSSPPPLSPRSSLESSSPIPSSTYQVR